MAAKKQKEHVVMKNGGFFCMNCGREYKVSYPVEPYMFAAQAAAFTKEHNKCPKTWTEPVADSNDTIETRKRLWLDGLHRGVSSETIFTVLSGQRVRLPATFCHPLDPSDFNRCHKLLETIPEWRPRMVEMKAVSPVWSALVDNWDKLTEMLQEQLVTGKSNGMYEFMKELGC